MLYSRFGWWNLVERECHEIQKPDHSLLYCSAFAVIGLTICGWLLISKGVVFPLALTLAFFCLGSLMTSYFVVSDVVWGKQMRWDSNAYRSGSASE